MLDTGKIAPVDSYTYDLGLWLDIDAIQEVSGNKTFRGQIRIEASQTT